MVYCGFLRPILFYTVVVYCDQSHFKLAERWLDTVKRFLLHPIVTMIPQNRMQDTKVYHSILPIWETSIVGVMFLTSQCGDPTIWDPGLLEWIPTLSTEVTPQCPNNPYCCIPTKGTQVLHPNKNDWSLFPTKIHKMMPFCGDPTLSPNKSKKSATRDL